MLSYGVLYTTAALMALVALACTALSFAWTIPAWRRRLAPAWGEAHAQGTGAVGLSGWPARVGSGLVSAGIAACALAAWYGLYCTVTAL